MADKRLQRIIAEDEKLFRAMQPGGNGKGAAAIRGEKKPDSKKPRKKKKRTKKVSSGVSQFDVFSFGVVDAIQRAMAPVSSPAREAIEEVETSSDVEQGPPVAATVPQALPQNRGSQESPKDPRPNPEPREPKRDAEPDYSLSESPTPEEGEFEFAQEEPEVNAGFSPTIDPINVQGGADLGLDDFSFESPVVKEVQALAAPEVKEVQALTAPEVKGEKKQSPLVQKRRERAQKERQAAAKNFQQQQQAPILGIPNPVPMQHADQDHRVDMAANPDEVALAIDETANAASGLLRNLVDLMDKFSEEVQALSARVRNIELVLDRL